MLLIKLLPDSKWGQNCDNFCSTDPLASVGEFAAQLVTALQVKALVPRPLDVMLQARYGRHGAATGHLSSHSSAHTHRPLLVQLLVEACVLQQWRQHHLHVPATTQLTAIAELTIVLYCCRIFCWGETHWNQYNGIITMDKWDQTNIDFCGSTIDLRQSPTFFFHVGLLLQSSGSEPTLNCRSTYKKSQGHRELPFLWPTSTKSHMKCIFFH